MDYGLSTMDYRPKNKVCGLWTMDYRLLTSPQFPTTGNPFKENNAKNKGCVITPAKTKKVTGLRQ